MRAARALTSVITAALISAPLVAAPGANAATGDVLLVVAAPTALTAAETVVRNRLLGNGFTVTLADDDTVSAGQTTGKAFVLLAQSTSSTATAIKNLATVAVPIWVAKPYSFPTFGLTGAVAGTDYGDKAATTLAIAAPGHPMAAGRTGTVTLQTKGSVSVGKPTAAATVIATNGTDAVVFVLPPGAVSSKGTPAPACRLTFPLYTTAPSSMTADGWAMFDATAAWATANCTAGPPPVDNAPSVAVTSPAAGSTVGGSVTLAASASDDHGVTSVAFRIDGSSVGTDTTSPYSVTWDASAVGAGTHSVTATATDTASQTTTSSAVSFTVAVAPPPPPSTQVLLVVAAPATLTTGEIAIRNRLTGAGYTVTIGDDDTVTPAQTTGKAFVLLAQSTSSTATAVKNLATVAVPIWVAKPYSFPTFGLTGTVATTDYGDKGATTLTIAAPGHPMAAGRTGTVTVQTKGNVSYGRPTAAATVIATSGTDAVVFVLAPGAVSSKGTPAPACRLTFPLFTTAPLSFTTDGWALFDAAAAWAAANCTAGPPPVDQPPTIGVTAPAQGSTVGGPVTLAASAADDHGVVSVAFAVDGTAVGTDTTSPYALTWDSSTVALGTHTVVATATDTAAHVTTSSTITFTVSTAPPGPASHVVLVSVDGLNPDAIRQLGAGGAPAFYRLIAQGTSTLNGRTLYEMTKTLPDHTGQLTGRPVDGVDGSHVTFDEDNGSTIHASAGEYVDSIFDVVHDHGGSTALYAGKTKFDFFDRTWDATNGAPDTIGADNGRDKIDTYLESSTDSVITNALIAGLTGPSPTTFSMIHLPGPDQSGHANGFMSAAYVAEVAATDAYIGQILDAIAASPTLAATTTVIVTTDHGGIGTSHADPTLPEDYTVPVFVWGAGVSPGTDLYALNPDRADPGTGRPDYTAPLQPIRNAEVGNLAAELMGYGAIPGSTIDANLSLDVATTP